MKLVTVLTGCYNEEENVQELYERVREQMVAVGRFRYEHIFIDNCSTDGTVAILRRIANLDKNIKVIVNARNFGPIRSTMHALNYASGDAVIGMVADLQDPPELIPELLAKWEQGYSMVLCIKKTSQENPLMFAIRRLYYRTIQRLSSIETFENFTGFGLYDRQVIDAVRAMNDPYPFFRGMIAEIGLPFCEIPYDQPIRKRGKSKHNFYSLYDMAMLGITQLSKVPLRLVTFAGFVTAAGCIFAGLVYFVYKLLFWNSFSLGIAPVILGMFFFVSVQLVSLGIIGEYVGSIYTYVQRRPYVIERERLNFGTSVDAPVPVIRTGTGHP